MAGKWGLAALFVLLISGKYASAGDVTPPLPGRFAAPHPQESPDFRRHVLPMMGRMGCNSRACHGSFQGQGGFRLSLFGYDFKADHDALTAGKEPRVNVKNPAESLILHKPTSPDDHGGGLRFSKDSWQYNVLRRWIDSGAKGVQPGDAEFARLIVTPAEIKFAKAGETRQLKVVASWSDGSSEDVTAISRYRSNDDAIATVNEDGLITCKGAGDSHIVAFYDNGITPVPVMLPWSDQTGDRYPQVAAPTEIDKLIVDKLRKVGIVPSPGCTDAEFLRRASLDVTGTLPTPREIETFLADQSPDKRAKKIDELLETPAYAAWWTTKLCDLTGDNPQQQGTQFFQREQTRQWYEWIYRRVANNMPYDQIMAGLLLANGRDKPGQSFTDYCLEMGSYMKPGNETDFASRKTMPYFFSRRNVLKPEEKALSVTYAMLGLRLECAQCHKHPFDQWTQKDFQQFQAFFQLVDYGVKPPSGPEANNLRAESGINKFGTTKDRRAVIQGIHDRIDNNKPVFFQELYVANPQQSKNVAARLARNPQLAKNPQFAKQLQKKGGAGSAPTVTPKLLGGEEVSWADTPDPRVKLMEWLRRKDNPYFARAWVNRVWAAYFGVGIVDPPDDNSMANPPSNGPLLNYLAQGFVAHNYDMKWLNRTILNTAAYQRSWKENPTNRLDNRNFSRALIRRLPAEVVNDALIEVTANDYKAGSMRSSIIDRAIGPDMQRSGDRYLLIAFGVPDRMVTCDCSRSNDPSLVQTIFLLNDANLRGRIDNGGWIQQLRQQQAGGPQQFRGQQQFRAQQLKPGGQIAAKPLNTDALIRSVFLRTVGHPPDLNENKEAHELFASAKTPVEGAKTLLWAMVNTKEFIVNH